MSDLPQVFIQLGICSEESFELFMVKVKEKFKEIRPEVQPDTQLNRMLFIEVLIMFAVEASENDEAGTSKADTLE